MAERPKTDDDVMTPGPLDEPGTAPPPEGTDVPPSGGAFAPLKDPTYRSIWSTSLLSNFGQLILGVGAAWEMNILTNGDPQMVALVQSALMLPLMLVAVPAGAIADMYDRRKVAIAGLVFASLSAGLLTFLALSGFMTPWLILGFCALIGVGVALYGPAWSASVREQVPPEHLPAAVALTSISYNIARSFGPAVGGVIVLALGATAAFAVNAVAYVPLIVAFLLWRRPPVSSRLPPERLDRAIVAGARYVMHSPPIRIVLVRSLAYAFIGSTVAALTPLVARDLLRGDAGTYGQLLGAYGVGAVLGALATGPVREKLKAEVAVSLCTVITGLCVIVIGISTSMILTLAAMFVAGALWMLLIALLNVAVQLAAPRWVTARALSLFQSVLTGGLAIGAWVWGRAAVGWGLTEIIVLSGIILLFTPILGFLLPMPKVRADAVEEVEMGYEPEVALAITSRSGPIIVEIDYDVDPDKARDFYDVMLKLQRARKRNGAFQWSLSRDIADPRKWVERYHCPTWGDYMRLRSRFTQADQALQELADSFHTQGPGPRVRRQLERPFGSVRWRSDTPDPRTDATIPIYQP